MIYQVFLDPYKHTPVALTDEQITFLASNQVKQRMLGNKTSGLWLDVFNQAVLIEADSPSEAEEKYNVGRIRICANEYKCPRSQIRLAKS